MTANGAASRFIHPEDLETLVFEWGSLKWLSEPKVTDTDRFTFGAVLLQPGRGHERHNHPGVEEILYCVSGEGMQMVDIDGEERRLFTPGMLIHIPPDVYHETINTGWEPMKIIAIYSPPGPEDFLRTLPDCKIVPPGSA